jgi:hypothetical protein
MKRFIPLVIVISITLNGFSHDYRPLVLEGNTWSVLSAGYSSIACCAKTDHYKIEEVTYTDSLNNGKMYVSHDSLEQDWEYIGDIRENMVNQKVWFRDLYGEEGLIYDFDMKVRDETTIINVNKSYNKFKTYQVIKIDSMFIQFEYRKVITLSVNGSWGDQTWIEGIGSTQGILNSNIYGLAGGFRQLLCFTDNYGTSYLNPIYQTCYMTKFRPLITNTEMNEAIVNKEYNFQITTTEIFDYDSINFSLQSLFAGATWLPKGLQLNTKTGLISGIPTETGTFPLEIYVYNHGLATDVFVTDLIVDTNTANQLIENKQNIKISPNISNGFITVDCSGLSENYTAMIYNLKGELILEKALNNIRNNEINVSTFLKGIYIIRVENSNSKSIDFSEKFVINAN